MTRIVVILSVLVAACDVGSIQQNSTGTDGGGSGSGSGSDCQTVDIANAPDGHHTETLTEGVTVTQAQALQGCMSAAGCHNAGLGLGTNAPEYSYGGTLFKDVAGTQPLAGAAVFVSINGVEKKTITANNGNFWFVPGIAGIDPPSNTMIAQTKASACPNTTAMVGAVVQGGGDCNSCHKTPGGTTAPMYVLGQ